MKMLTARPEHIIGNVALASLVSGVGAGSVVGIVAGLAAPSGLSVLDWLRGIGSTMMIGAFFVFVCGTLFVAPILALLRRVGFGGPFFVFTVSAAFSIVALSDSLRFGMVVAAFALVATLVFYRHAYARDEEVATHRVSAAADDTQSN